MKNIKHTLAKQFIAAVAAAALFAPIMASAQDVSYDGGDQQISGTVSSINGTWNLTVNDSNGYSDSVALHQGTIINPTGLTLEPGMNVTIDGYADGQSFDATEIDTPYQYEGPAPTAVYYGDGAWYPGYAEGWGPSFSIFFDANTRRYEQRSFNVRGQIRRPVAPPSGWQNRPHGFIGTNGNARPQQRTAYVPQQQRTFAAPQQRTFAAPQQPQQRTFAAPQQPQQRTFAAPQQPTFAAPQQPQTRSFSDQRQQQPARNFAAPQQQQQRTFAPPQQQARPAAEQPQQQRNFTPQRDFSSPTSRAGTFTPRENNQTNDHRRG